MIWFMLGTMVGGIGGFMVACLCAIQEEDDNEHYRQSEECNGFNDRN